MKKTNIIMLVLLSIMFTQCKPDDENNTIQYKGISSINSNKANVDEMGITRWTEDDVIFGYGLDFEMSDIVVELNVTSISSDGKTAEFYCEHSSGPFVPGESPVCRDLYLIKEPGTYKEPGAYKDFIAANLMNQTGESTDIGKYFVAHSKVKFEAQQNNTFFFTGIFNALSSVARVNLAEASGKVVRVNYSGLNNVFYIKKGQIDPSNDYSLTCTNKYVESDMYEGITITQPSSDTYISLLPQENPEPTIVTFSDASSGDIIGTVKFPNGIKSGKLYAGPEYSPIELNSRNTIVETEL